MIIKVDNANSKQYEKVFKDAYETLLEAGKIQENEIGRLSSLEEFFSHIQEIYQADSSFLIKLPVDEPVLAIDANKRTIDTTLFNKTASVQSDEVAEIAVFSIDRYFDYMDFATTEIWVQWTAPGADGVPREGATLIELKDVETEPGKVRFGWPLDSDVTAVPGNVQFAVRFFKRGDVIEQNLDGSTSTVNKIVYSFNTLPATLKIASALQPELNPETELNKPQGLFAYSIINSMYTGEDTAIPQTPTFGAPGLDLPVTATLKEDTLTLKAQAVVGDTGTIRYKWYYTPVGETVAKDVENMTGLDEESTEEKVTFGTVGILYSEIDGTKEVISEVYYVKNGEAYEEYLGDFPVAEDVVLYEKFTTFTVPISGDVTGTYQVKAVNNNGFIDGKEQMSYPCVLVSPSDVVIKEDLPLIAIMTASGEETANVMLKVIVERAAGDNSVYTYDWLKSETLTGDLTSINGFVENNTLTITEPGWYSVNINSHLNRQTNELTSKVRTKVTFMPTAPIIGYDNTLYKVDANQTDRVHTIESYVYGSQVVLTVQPTVANAGTDPDLYGEDNLYSEGLRYQWLVIEADKDPRALQSSEIVGGSITSDSVTVLASAEQKDYVCVVTNDLNGQEASAQLVFEIE